MLSRTQNDTFSAEATTRPDVGLDRRVAGELLEVPMVVLRVEERTSCGSRWALSVHVRLVGAGPVRVQVHLLNGGAIVGEVPVPVAVVPAGEQLDHTASAIPDDAGEPEQLHTAVLDDPKLDDGLHHDVGQQLGRTAVGDARAGVRDPDAREGQPRGQHERDHTEARVA